MATRIKDLDSITSISDDFCLAVDNDSGTKSLSLKTLLEHLHKYFFDDTVVPLIDWEYIEPNVKRGFATSVNGTIRQWLFENTVLYNQIYDPGRYANYIYPLKEDFMNYNELKIVFGDYSGGTPDIATKTFKTRDFDFVLSLPINPNCKNMYSAVTPNSYVTDFIPLWLPYKGSAVYSFNQYARSTRTKLMSYGSYGAMILEIYGIGKKLKSSM